MLSSLSDPLSRHPRRTLLLVGLFVAVAGIIGGPLAGSLKSSGGFAPTGSDSQVAIAQLQRATGSESAPGLVLLVRTPAGVAASTTSINAVSTRLATVPGVLRTTAPAAIARDGHEVLVTATLRASASDDATAKAARAAFAASHDVTVGGPAVAGLQIHDAVTSDLGRAELLAFPLLLVLSLIFFGGRAALLPLVVGATTVLGTFLVLTGVNQLYGLSVFALNLVIGLGLGLGIDYSLFLLTRYREELSTGTDPARAIAVTVSRAGRTVFFSASTVAVALATLNVFPQGFLKSMGTAGAVVAIMAALSSMVITPALLAIWGRRVAGRPTSPDGSGRWYRFAHAVMRRPGPVALVTAAIMVAMALPSLSTVWTPIDSSVVPKGLSARTVSDAIGRDFAGAGRTPVTVAIDAPGSDATAVQVYARRAARQAGVTAVANPRPVGPALWQLTISVRGDSAGSTAQRVVRALRGFHAPFRAYVSGDAATFVDQQDAIGSHLPLAIALLAGFTFLILWLMTDSIVLPAKALLMNALTVGAALAPLTLIYQHGRLTELLGYTPNGGVEPSDFLVTATLVFALSTDYGVFLLGRIKEARDHGRGEREAVATGLAQTGRVVTAAAILLAVAIGAFSTSSISFIQQIGVASATGVLIDAFIVRSLLVPSLMALLGRWNWYSPRPLRRLRARVTGGPSAIPAAVASSAP